MLLCVVVPVSSTILTSHSLSWLYVRQITSYEFLLYLLINTYGNDQIWICNQIISNKHSHNEMNNSHNTCSLLSAGLLPYFQLQYLEDAYFVNCNHFLYSRSSW